jgi:hypothetical protein
MPPVNGRHFAFILIVKRSETIKNIITAKLETWQSRVSHYELLKLT